MNINQNNLYGNNVINFGKQNREFNTESQQQLKTMIGINDNILIMSVVNDPEAALFAETVKNHLISHGYKVKGVEYAMWPFPVTGLHINDIDVNGERSIIIGHNNQ